MKPRANPGAKKHLLLGITNLRIWAPQAAHLPPHAPLPNKCQRKGEWKRVKLTMASQTVQPQLEAIRFHIFPSKEYDMKRYWGSGALKSKTGDHYRGVLNQQGHSIKHESSRQRKRTFLIENKQRIQWEGMTCPLLKGGNMLALEAAATPVLLLDLFLPKTLPQAHLVDLPTLFRGIYWFYKCEPFKCCHCSLGLSASGVGGKMAEVGWKFTSLAGQKAAELSENVTEKVCLRNWWTALHGLLEIFIIFRFLHLCDVTLFINTRIHSHLPCIFKIYVVLCCSFREAIVFQ